ncbi:MAG: transposase, partial [Steroidobacteraceae bacterium]|nr:transposase [Steroidobacteraceae bacterium]
MPGVPNRSSVSAPRNPIADIVERRARRPRTCRLTALRLDGLDRDVNGAARAGGFSLHAGVDVAPRDRATLERLCRYISRPPAATERLALTPTGQVRYALSSRSSQASRSG